MAVSGRCWLLRVLAQVTELELAAANAVVWAPAFGKQHCRTGLTQAQKQQMVAARGTPAGVDETGSDDAGLGGGSDAMLMLSWLSTMHTAM